MRAADEEAIRSVESRYDAAWSSGDVASLVATFTREAVVIDPFGRIHAGITGLEEFLRSFLGGEGKGSRHVSSILRVSFVTDDVAIADGEATIYGLRAPEGGSAPPFVHRFTDILVKEGATWRIAHVRAYVLAGQDAS